MLLQLAWKNIWRNKKRSGVIIAAIGTGLCGGLFASGVMLAINDSLVRTAIDRSIGHIQLHARGFTEDRLLNQTIPHPDSIITAVRLQPGVVGVSGRTIIEGMVSSASQATSGLIVGIRPADERQVSSIAHRMTAGSFFDSSGANQIIVGSSLAGTLSARLHGKIVLSFVGADGEIIYGGFRIGGLYESGSTSFDKLTVFVRQSDLLPLLGGRSMVHEIAVRLSSAAVVPACDASLKARYEDLSVQTWKEIAPQLKLAVEMSEPKVEIMLAIIILALVFGITNTMLMSVMERLREFGMLMAIGMNRSRLFMLIIVETVMLSLTGGALGVSLGTSVVMLTGTYGIDLSRFAEGLSGYGIASMLYPTIPLSVYLSLTLMVLVATIVAAAYPAIRAIRFRPAAAIRTYQ